MQYFVLAMLERRKLSKNDSRPRHQINCVHSPVKLEAEQLLKKLPEGMVVLLDKTPHFLSCVDY
jgi:hypothetical protein